MSSWVLQFAFATWCLAKSFECIVSLDLLDAAGVLRFLVDEAVTEQTKRAMAVYTALHCAADEGSNGLSAEEVTTHAARLLAAASASHPDAIEDSTLQTAPWPTHALAAEAVLDSLAPLGMWVEVDGGEGDDGGGRRWCACPPAVAKQRLRQRWDSLLLLSQHDEEGQHEGSEGDLLLGLAPRDWRLRDRLPGN